DRRSILVTCYLSFSSNSIWHRSQSNSIPTAHASSEFTLAHGQSICLWLCSTVQNATIAQPAPNVMDRCHRIRFGTDHSRTQFLLRMRYRNLLWHMCKAFASGFAAQYAKRDNRSTRSKRYLYKTNQSQRGSKLLGHPYQYSHLCQRFFGNKFFQKLD